MRFAWLLRQRRSLFMQFDPPRGPGDSLASRIGLPLKRPYGQAATVRKDESQKSPKYARVDRSPPPPKKPDSPPRLAPGFIPKGPKAMRRVLSPDILMPSWRNHEAKPPQGHDEASGSSASSSRHARGRTGGRGGRGISKKVSRKPLPQLTEPLTDAAYISEIYKSGLANVKTEWENNPKSTLMNYMKNAFDDRPEIVVKEGVLKGKMMFRATVSVNDVVGQGDSVTKKDSEMLACQSAVFQLALRGAFNKSAQAQAEEKEIKLSDGGVVTHERARQFMDYYCRRYGFGKPDISFEDVEQKRGNSNWEAVMTVGGRRIGLGTGKTKKQAQANCYLDVTQYLESCDKDLWKAFVDAAKTGKDLGLAPRVMFTISDRLEDEIRDLCADIKSSTLYKNRPAIGCGMTGSDPAREGGKFPRPQLARPAFEVSQHILLEKSERLSKRREQFLEDPKHEKMRQTRATLPVYTRAEEILDHIDRNDVTICMAATGSGKTTQIPQLILDHWIKQGRGAECNVVCTQPRRIAAVSVADRVAKERGEQAGPNSTVGYQVRFEALMPEDHGSITFCTTGVFLKRMQTALQAGGHRSLDNLTHVVVDEVHERDVDTDLLLVVLKRFLADRKARNNPLKVVLMSATIDSTLFQNYFTDEAGNPSSVIDIPGRSFPVEKHFLDEIVPEMVSNRGSTGWVFSDEKVAMYLNRELGPSTIAALGIMSPRQKESLEELEIPYPLVALTISYVLRKSSEANSGHVLVFLPGWEEIQTVQRILLDRSLPLGVDFTDTGKYSLHILHSTIPLAEQQQIFEPAPPGVRRIILSTNIAETSVTIPDVVYVVDTAKIKENRYDPERHMTSLVSAWVGKSNLNQRAGRAGRHRPGEYYGILGENRANELHTHQTVEMKRTDLSNVVMHVKALDFPGMEVEEVLAATIEPPEAERVSAALTDLTMVGALDSQKNLTSLGRVLLQLPIDVQLGRLVLFGSFFRCLDQALTLAAVLSNRDPFLNPPLQKREAQLAKDSWTPGEFRSDALAVVSAFHAWWELQGRGHYVAANRFLNDNFLSKPTMLLISKIKGHLLQSLYRAGVIDVSAGGAVYTAPGREPTVPAALNANGACLPLLAALIAIASQPKFAIKTSPMSFRTALDKQTVIHPSSVNHRKRENADYEPTTGEKQIIAFTEKRQNLSMVGSAPGQMYLVGCTRLDPMAYMLFGAYRIEVTEHGLECDQWLPIVGDVDALDDIQRLKVLMESCMLRVFEGINMSRRRRRGVSFAPRARDVEPDESDDEDDVEVPRDLTLSSTEIKELDYLTRDIVSIMDKYNQERLASHSRRNSRPGTPMGSPFITPIRHPIGLRSGTSTPYRAPYDSRPNTPSRFGA